MTTLIADELRLHVEHGSLLGSWIWFARKGQHSAYPLGPAEFVSQEWVHAAGKVRLLGTAANSPLIEELYKARHLSGTPTCIQVGSPGACLLDAKERPTSLQVFQRMDALEQLRPSVGGWHDLSSQDYTSYALARAIYAERGRCSDLVERFLRAHPAWPVMSFIPTHNWRRSALLLTFLLDPRWYVDPQNPDRSARLKTAFCLGPGREPLELLGAILDGSVERLPEEAGRRAAKLQMVLESWAGTASGSVPQDVVSDPRQFLWRIALDRPTDTEVTPKGLLRASRVFLRLLCAYWTSKIAGFAHPDLFVPDYFFEDPAVVSEWQRHIAEGPV